MKFTAPAMGRLTSLASNLQNIYQSQVKATAKNNCQKGDAHESTAIERLYEKGIQPHRSDGHQGPKTTGRYGQQRFRFALQKCGRNQRL